LALSNRSKSSKKLCYKIAMAKGIRPQKKHRQLYRQLIRIANEVFTVASYCCGHPLHFRAGIQGIISAMVRGCGLKRCLWKGWQYSQSYVGLAIMTANLQKIAQLSLAN
jgi:hypothetical protein